MRHARPRTLLTAAAALALGVGCYPDRIDNTQDLDTVTTIFDSQGDFAGAKRFALPDSIVVLAAEGETSLPSVSATLQTQVLAAIRQNMTNAGYVEETQPRSNPPDVVVVAAATTTTNIGYVVSNWWSYYGWYGGWYYPYYGAGWGWTYPPGYAYSYTTGTLVTTMVDNRKANVEAKQVPVIWVAAVNGVIAGNETQRAVDGINQAFAQSPYLKSSR